MAACAIAPSFRSVPSPARPFGCATEYHEKETAVLYQALRYVVKRFASAGSFPSVPRLGLDQESFERLLVAFRLESTSLRQAVGPPEDFWELTSLLIESGDGSEETRWVAHAVATACLADDHLWQDLGLPDRNALTRLLERYFRPLRERNVGDMRWKKFFYKQLCERAGFHACKAPSCRECSDYPTCFGKE
ncbi:nitrogen fixation protein NifQ [Verrucomicrobium sp. 3C]|uniref:nitrogen fixation protein NifQ n=1 Tax=Verrucomicrobium sp. 3C TaxID=1134055 RepID=UPI00035DE696|nr:nitrogen fixation protein NifQ [Verrucomicrobium sp. 3C]